MPPSGSDPAIPDVLERLRESEERYRAIVESSRDAIVEVDESGAVTWAAGAAEEILAYSPQQLCDLPPLSRVHPDDRDRVWQALVDAFRHGRSVEIAPLRVQRRDGAWIWYECRGISYTRADGERRFLALGRDVTTRLGQEQERRELEARAREGQRLEGLGVLAGGIVHDFNNLLAPILGEARLAQADLPPASPVRERLEHIQRAAERAAELGRRMLACAGAEAPRPETLELSRIVGDTARLVARGASAAARVAYALDEDLPPIHGDASQIGQVVMNLVTNALEAVGAGPGEVRIRTGCVELGSRPEARAPGMPDPLPPGLYAWFEVEDSGCGMDAETRSRVFDPFFTTKVAGRGLGLAAVLGIVRSHGGGIELETGPGRGARFRVLLPAASPPRKPALRVGKPLARSA